MCSRYFVCGYVHVHGFLWWDEGFVGILGWKVCEERMYAQEAVFLVGSPGGFA